MNPIYQVALGGALGAVLRFVMVGQVGRLLGLGFPWGTMAVNIAGCLAMGALVGLLGPRLALAPFLLTGVLGGFTTFSAFSIDALNLYERGQTGPAMAYVVVTVLGSLLAVYVGFIATRGAPA